MRRDLAALGLAAVVLAALLYLGAVHSEPGQRLDNAAFGRLAADRNPVAVAATEELLQTVSVSSLALLGGALMALAAVRRRLDLAVAAGVLIAGANLTTQLLKLTLPRPELVAGPELGPGTGLGTLPSGHATVAMSLALALALVAPPATRAVAAVVGGAYAIGVGVATLALDWHRPSDVLTAYLVATAWAALVAAALARRDRPSARAASSGRAARLGGLAAAALGTAFLAVAAVAAARRVDVVAVAEDRTAFLAAAVAVALTGAALLAAVAALLGPRAPRPG